MAAACAGATAEELARAVAFAAALRLVRFHLNNDPGDWDTVHHTFTYANAVHQAVVRQPTSGHRARHRARRAPRVPRSVPQRAGGPAPDEHVGDARGPRRRAGTCKAQSTRPGDAVAGFLRGGGGRAELVAALGHALLQEDAGFHWYQSIEAGVRQASAWPEGSDEAMLVLVGVARFLAAHTPDPTRARDDLAHGRPAAARGGPLRRRVTSWHRPFGPDVQGHARVAAVSDPNMTSSATDHLGDPVRALADQLGLADSIVDADALANSVERFREQGIVLPTFAQLADPSTIDPAITAGVDKNAADARNLFRVHWFNDLDGNRVDVPDHVVLPPELTGIESPVIVVFGDRFPMITAHKVLGGVRVPRARA